jgi:hypothetical protein
MRRDDATWTVLSLPTWNAEMRNALAVINRELAERLKDGDSLQFGICYGRQVEFEYEITTASGSSTRAISDSLTQSFAGLEKESTLLRSTEAITEGNTVHGIITVSMARYNAWLTEVSARGGPRNTAVQ